MIPSPWEINEHLREQCLVKHFRLKTQRHPGRLAISWHILGDRLIPLAPLSLVGFYMSPAKSLTFKFCLDFYLKTGCGGQQLLRNGEGRIQQSKNKSWKNPAGLEKSIHKFGLTCLPLILPETNIAHENGGFSW